MQLLTAGILFSVVFFADSIRAELNSDGENVCLQTETYEETIDVEVLKPFIKKTTKRCWSLRKLFKCEVDVTEWKRVKEPRVINRTSIVAKCCDGYAEEIGQVNKCSPVCLNGCNNGQCGAPGVCACDSGFYGLQCEKACPRNFWGDNCSNKCDCSDNGNCDHISGECHCDSGWRGKSCELQCPNGFYGYHCQEKCSCDNHLCNHKTGECTATTTEYTIIVTSPSTTQDSTAETSEGVYQQTENSETTDKETVTIEKDFLAEGTKQTVKENLSSEITSESSDVITNLRNESSKIKTTEEPNKNEKETKVQTINLGQITSSRNIEDAMNISKEVSISETFSIFNSTETTSIWTSLSQTEINLDKNETKNITNGRKESSSHKRTLTLFHFIPSLSVISSTSFLIFIIAAKWIISRHRKKAGTKTIATGKKEKLFRSDEQIKFQTENIFWVNNCTKNPLPDIELNATPILETFKPATPNS